jgi:CopG family nickel-responsive transcriptional regulator
MERITMSLDEELAAAFDQMIAGRGYTSRSEALRELIRREVEAHRIECQPRTPCVATLSYVYNHHVRELSERLMDAQHAHHDLVVATSHVHLDHEHCLESAFLKGTHAAVRAFANAILAQRGVTHGQLNVITVESGDRHTISSAHHHNGHMHLTPHS